jgi:drug/metabolite transporter (DMT)-like permease
MGTRVLTTIVVSLALVAAFLYGLSDFLEQRAASRAARGGALHRMVRDPKWMLGWTVGTVAHLVQAVALKFGSVAVVQSLQVTTLLFSLRLSTIGVRERAGAREYTGGGLVCAGLALFLSVRGDTAGVAHPARGRILLMLAIMASLVVAMVLVSLRTSGTVRAVALALAAGIALGSGATLVKLTVNDLTERGIPATATDWPGYTLAAVTGTGLVLQQIAFGAGRLPTATTAMVVVNPLVGSAIAIEGFGEHLPHSPDKLAGIAVAAVLLIIGVAMLAHSPLLHGTALDDAAAATDQHHDQDKRPRSRNHRGPRDTEAAGRAP